MQLRPVRIVRGFARHAEGSALIECGETRVLCTASIEDAVPSFLKGSGRGWITGYNQYVLDDTRRSSNLVEALDLDHRVDHHVFDTGVDGSGQFFE